MLPLYFVFFYAACPPPRQQRFGLVTNLDVIQAMLASKRNMDRAVIQVKINKALLDIAAMQ